MLVLCASVAARALHERCAACKLEGACLRGVRAALCKPRWARAGGAGPGARAWNGRVLGLGLG